MQLTIYPGYIKILIELDLQLDQYLCSLYLTLSVGWGVFPSPPSTKLNESGTGYVLCICAFIMFVLFGCHIIQLIMDFILYTADVRFVKVLN